MRAYVSARSTKLIFLLLFLAGALSVSAVTFAGSIFTPIGTVTEGSLFASVVSSLYGSNQTTVRVVSTDPATVRTNKAHYSPGDTAKITGENFGAFETVTLQVTHTDGTPSTGGGHEPWTATTDGSGLFITTWYVDPDDSLHSTFLLTAVSATASASANFSDPGPSADLDQCRNGDDDDPNNCIGDGSGGTGWVNGNVGDQQGHFVEGYSIPYRMRLADVTAGTWTLDIGYDTVHSGKHAIDFLTRYDRINDPVHTFVFGHAKECIDPSDSWIGGAANEDNCPPEPGVAPSDTHDIPKPILPASVAGNPPGTPPCTTPYPGGEVLPGAVSCPDTEFERIADLGDAYMSMWNGSIDSISYVSQNVVSGQGQQHTRVRIVFTVTAQQAAEDGGQVLLAWGGHIGRAQDWGTLNSAGGISGSPYHMNLEGLCAGTTPAGQLCADGGSQDRSLSAKAVSRPGTIVINKNIQAGGIDGTFGYSTTGDGLSNFNLTTVGGAATTSFTNLQAGPRTVNESTIPNTHLFVSLVCVDPDNGTTTNGTTANIDLDEGETVTCTYTNRENPNVTQGRIVITKDTIPNDTQSFTFTPSYPGVPPYAGGTFSLIDGGSNDSCGAGDNCLQAGVAQSVTETPNSAYATTASCPDVVGESFNPATGTLSNIPVNAGQTTYCTFTNRKPDAQIDLTPLTDTNPVNQSHRITATVQQDDTYAAGAPGDGTSGFGPAPDGTLVTFSLLNNTAGATFVGGVNTCTTTGGTGQCFVDINTSTAGGVDIHATTTFNVLGVSLTRATGTGGLNSADAHKTYVDAQIDLSPLVDTNPVNEAHTFTATVQQDDGIPAGAPGDGATGFGPAPNGTVVTFSFETNNIGAVFVGGVNTCTITNGLGTCTVQINSSSPGTVVVRATTTFSVGGQSLTRTTGSGGLNSADAQKTYVAGNIITRKVTNPAGDSQLFDFNASWDSGGAPDFQLSDGQQNDSGYLPPSTYSVAETVPTGWDLTTATCSDGSPVNAISLQAGETVTCTFTNVKRGRVTLTKTFEGGAIPAGESFTFQLRQGASTDPVTGQGTTLDSVVVDSTTVFPLQLNGLLVPGEYQVCEFILPGWDSSIRTMTGAFVPASDQLPENVDNSYVCVPVTVDPGETESITIDNSPPPGGMAKTIGFWKNWSSCTGGRQAPVLDQTLASFPLPPNPLPTLNNAPIDPASITTHGVYIGDLYVDTCAEGFAVLNKSTLGGKKNAKDPAFNMAAQLLAAKLNIQAGAEAFCIGPVIAEAQRLLDLYNFNGNTHTNIPKTGQDSQAEMLYLQGYLDAYNNNDPLGCPIPTYAP